MSRSTIAIARRGFSLVELLVVIGIITLLLSILMPAISRARAAAKDVSCLSNLRQLGAGFQMYQNEFEQWPCPAKTGASQWWSQDWIYPVILGKMPTKPTRRTTTGFAGRIFECPATANFDLPAGENDLWRSYGMSARLNNRYDDTGDFRGDFKHPNDVRTPSETCLLIDCTQQWSGTLVTATPAPSNSQLQHVQDAAARHGQRLNVLYCDLHADSIDFDAVPTVASTNQWQKFWAGVGTE